MNDTVKIESYSPESNETGFASMITGGLRSKKNLLERHRLLVLSVVIIAFIMQGWTGPRQAQAAAVWQATGTVVSAAGAVAWPAHAVNDVALLFVETANEAVTLSTPAGFVEVANSPQVTGTAGSTGATRLTVYWARATSASMTSPVIGGAYDHVVAVIVTFRGVSTSGDPCDITTGSVKAAASTTTTFPAVTTTIPGDMIVLAAAVDLDAASTAVWSAWTNANLTGLTERVDQTIATGRGGGLGVATGSYAGPGNTGTSTGTLTSSITTQMTIALRPAENLTRTGSASATAASATSILVTMPYMEDTNGNNTYTVDYKLSSASIWTNWVTNAVHTASPYSTTITGLTTGELYDVRMTYNDGDTVLGTNPQIVSQIVVGTSTKTTAGLVNVKAGNTGIKITMPYFNDSDGNNTYTVRYKLSSSGTWSTHVTGAGHVASPYVTTINGLTKGQKYDVEMTYNDAAGVTGYGAVQTRTKIKLDTLVHNSHTTGSKTWSNAWGNEGGKYGEFVCETCHNKNTSNIKRIQSGIGTPDGTNWVSSATRTVTVNFQSTTAPNGFGDDSATHGTSSKICEVCHSQNDFHNYNQATAQTHQNNADCMASCHSHNQGFSGDGPCKSCHNAAINEAYNVRKIVETTTGDGTGEFVRLSRHVSNGTSTEIVTNYDCIVCHAEGDAGAASAKTGYVDTSVHRNGNSATSRMVKLRNVDNITQTYDWNNNAPTEAMRTNMDTFCLNCHDANGSSGIAVTGVYTAPSLSLTPTAAKALKPFNDTDTQANGRDGLGTRSRVIDIKTLFTQGSLMGANYNGYASQHAVLGQRYWSANTNWTGWQSHTLRNGNNVSTTKEQSRLHCSDCHLSEMSSHGAVNAFHMLLNGTANDFTSDTVMAGSTATTAIVCYKCHASNVYSSTQAAGSRFPHNTDSNVWGSAYDVADNSAFGGPCLNCHAGDGFGNIHGVNGTYTSNGGTYTRYRFLGGGEMAYMPGTALNDNVWTETGNTGTCYFTNTTWSNCAHHSTGATSGGGTQAYGRAAKY